MTDEETIREAAKAVQEVGRAVTTGIKAGEKAGAYIANMFGTVPQDAVGLLGGDYLHEIRLRNFERIHEKTSDILRARGVTKEAIPISPRIGVPFLEAASMESGEDLQDIWAQLIANARDPNRDTSLQRGFIEALSSFEPIDALILGFLSEFKGDYVPISKIAVRVSRREDQVIVSKSNLEKLECVILNNNSEPAITAFGRELLLACQP